MKYLLLICLLITFAGCMNAGRSGLTSLGKEASKTATVCCASFGLSQHNVTQTCSEEGGGALPAFSLLEWDTKMFIW